MRAEDTNLAAWLLGHGPTPPPSTLRTARLTAYAYTALPEHDPVRPFLRADFVASLGRHEQIKAELLPLLAAWRDADIDVLLFKGFQLSEFVYRHPGARYHGDVDLLIRPTDVRRAERIAVDQGWHAAKSVALPLRHTHGAFVLSNLGGGTRVDVHREILHAYLPWHSVQRRITEAVWDASITRQWNGIEIREPAPVDMLLVALVLQRAWGPEAWQVKPHDVIDFRQITSRFEVTRDALRERARELRCERTLESFLERCDPEAGRLDLAPISATQLRRFRARAFSERGLLGGFEVALARAITAPFALPLALRFVPTVLRVRRALHRHTDLRSLLDSVASAAMTRAPEPAMTRDRIVIGTSWARRLVGSGRFGPCLVHALAAFIELRRRGHTVDFVSGVRRDGAAVIGHAWLEYDGGMPWEMDEPATRARFRENFRYPGGVRAPVRRGRAPVVPTPGGREALESATRSHRG